jgi:hypothetical protein
MSLVDVMTGLQTWDSYIGNRDLVRTLDRGLSAHSRPFRLGAEAGNVAANLGALGNQLSASFCGRTRELDRDRV